MHILDFLLGRRLANREEQARRIGWFEAVPAMGLDGMGSASYGPEAALAVLAPLGAASLQWIGPVMAPIVALLVILYLSYRQTVAAYRTNGGAYAVAKENLGRNASLLAASALMIDYVLNVAVGVSAGVGALTSSIPVLHAYALPICLAVLAIVTVANLRGLRESGLLFAVPTYGFMASFLGLIGLGLVRTMLAGGHPHPVAPPSSPFPAPGQMVTLWVLVRAFAAGCTAMTGVEAVSNAVGAFRDPVQQQAQRTLTVICGVLALLLAGVAYLAHAYGLSAMDQSKAGYQSLLSQLAAAIAGRGGAYDLAMACLLAVLCLSANTSFVAFPRLCRMLAADGFLPRPFAVADRRLVFSVGVVFLALTAGALLIVFGGITDRLIPLFAIGAFLTFTLSQIGMVAHWRRVDGKGRRRRLAINGLGATITSVALAVIVAAKFTEGAWIVVVAIPGILWLLLAVHRYYQRLDRELEPEPRFVAGEELPPTVILAIDARTRVTDRALSLAMSLSPDVIAVHLLELEGPETEDDCREIRRRWRAQVEQPLAEQGRTAPKLLLIPAPFREIHRPLLDLVERLDAATPRRQVAVLIPELLPTRPWERLLHGRQANRLRAALFAHGGPRLNVMTVPWRRDSRPAKRERQRRSCADAEEQASAGSSVHGEF